MFLAEYEDNRDVRRRDAGDAGGLADGSGAYLGEALASLGFESRDGVVVDGGGDFTMFLLAHPVCSQAHTVDVSLVDDFCGDRIPELPILRVREELPRQVGEGVLRTPEPELKIDSLPFCLPAERDAFLNGAGALLRLCA